MLQRVAQLAELFIDERADSACPAAAQETVDRAAMARGDPVVDMFALRIPPFRKACAVEELIGHSLKRGDDDDGGPAIDASRTIRPTSRMRSGVARDDPPNLKTRSPSTKGSSAEGSSWACGSGR